MVGEGVLVISLECSNGWSLGGSSRHLWCGRVTRAVQGRGFPGSSSQRNGTEAEVWWGGVERPGGFGDSLGDNMRSFGVELSSDAITHCVCVCV